MKTLELECPSCQEVLELDAGFAGGVCRCSNCGTLMTVPSDAGRAETLSRPASGPASDFNDDSFSDTAAPPRRSSAGSRKKKSKQRLSGSRSGSVEPGEYVTESGKVVKLDGSVRVPIATRRKQARIATIVVFCGVIFACVAAGVVAIILMVGSGSGADASSQTYDPAANPFDLTFANVAGLPLQGEVAVVVEASEASSNWIAKVGEMVAIGLSQPGDGVRVALHSSADSVEAIGSTHVEDLDQDDVVAWFSKLPAPPSADLSSAMASAMGDETRTLILIVSGASSSQVASWKSTVQAADNADELTVHVVLLGGSPADVRRWLSDDEASELVVLSPQDIDGFRSIAESLED